MIAQVLSGIANHYRKNEEAMQKAQKKLAHFTLAELAGASVNMYDVPDITNPSGYYDRWVVLERRIFFGLFKVDTIVFFEPTCDESGEERQRDVYNYVLNLLTTIKRS
jgi:hypothetical protein